VRELSAKGGKAFEIRDGATRDLFLMGDSLTEAVDFASDFQLSWIRLAGETADLEELVLLAGHRLSLGGLEIVDSSDFITYLRARRCGPDLCGETDRINDWHGRLPEWQVAVPGF
jgi:hypothetical protein